MSWTTADLIFWSCFTFGFVSFLWELYLSWRQYCKQRDTVERPDYLRELMDDESFKKARSYSLDNSRFSFASDIWSAFENIVILLCNLIYISWEITGQYMNDLGLGDNEILHSLFFMFATSFISFVINFPWKLYHTFVIEQKHGFNKQTLGFFIVDQIKKQVLMLAIGAPVLGALLWIIQQGGDYFFLFVWVFLLILTFFLMTIYPEFIAPLFDKYTPLRDGNLKTKIEALASRLNYPLKKLYVVEGSKRSAHSNAYMYGFWNNKRIVLYDTLIADYSPLNGDSDKSSSSADQQQAAKTIGGGGGASGNGNGNGDKESTNSEDWEKPDVSLTRESEERENDQSKGRDIMDDEEKEKLLGEKRSENITAAATSYLKEEEEKPKQKKLGMSDDEVVAVLGHELGHWKLNHTMCNIIVAELNLLLCMVIFSLLYKFPVLYEAFGFTKSQPTLIGLLIIFSFIFAPYNEVWSFVMTWWSRRCEFDADKFSAQLGYAPLLRNALIKLSKDNLSFPVDDWLFSAWHHSHPPTPERIEALKKFD